METIRVILLTCAAAMDRSACTEINALDRAKVAVVTMPEQCAFYGMTMPAGSSYLASGREVYLKVVCKRERVASAAR